jgi:hypothetical protein
MDNTKTITDVYPSAASRRGTGSRHSDRKASKEAKETVKEIRLVEMTWSGLLLTIVVIGAISLGMGFWIGWSACDWHNSEVQDAAAVRIQPGN